MAIKSYFLKDLGFVLIEVSGQIDDENILASVEIFNDKTESISNLRQLSDFRELVFSNNLTGQGAMDAAHALKEKKEGLLALLIDDTNYLHDLARVFKAFAAEKRKSINIFTDVESALSWLTNNDHEKKVLREFVSQCH